MAKDSLPEIPVSNVVSLSMIKRDLKKKTMEIIPNYRQVGILEGTSSDGSVDRFSIANCQRELQRSASQIKIQNLRRSFENLIGKVSKPEATGDDEEAPLVDNPFSSATLHKDTSLSVYNTPKKLAEEKERPVMTQDFLLRGMKGYKKPAPKVEKGEEPPPEEPPVEVREPTLPEFQNVTDLIIKDSSDYFRQNQLEECFDVNNSLALAVQ